MRVVEGKKKAAHLAAYATLIQDATELFSGVSDRASLDRSMPEIDSLCVACEDWNEQLSKMFFTIQDAKKLNTMARLEAVEKPFRESRTEMLHLFDDDRDLQRELVEKLKKMPHLQARIGGKLELEREFHHLFE